MSYAERLERIAVLGAAGKMGSGIVLLAAMEMADQGLDPANAGRTFSLQAIDLLPAQLAGLTAYLRTQVQKSAEKRIVALRQAYEARGDLVENEDVVRQYVDDAMAVVRPSTRIESAYGANLVFEAINEDPDLKVRVLGQVDSGGDHETWFLTNTSSVPIGELDAKARLGGRIVGFHFYNPPAVQKLVELIRAETTAPALADFAQELAKRLRKTVVPSRDVAGFIGNGHFMRDALHGIAEAERLAAGSGFVDAVYMVNRVSQDFLLRPMGIFQLVDYVGLDVCQKILKVMADRMPGAGLRAPILERMLSLGVVGGQYPDGSQKDGFLKYERGRPAAIYDPEAKAYVPLAEAAARSDPKLGPLPASAKPWKAVIGLPDRAAFLETYFAELRAMTTPGAELAVRHGRRSGEIGRELVATGVAARDEDVNTVLLTGFFHAYGPINPYFD